MAPSTTLSNQIATSVFNFALRTGIKPIAGYMTGSCTKNQFYHLQGNGEITVDGKTFEWKGGRYDFDGIFFNEKGLPRHLETVDKPAPGAFQDAWADYHYYWVKANVSTEEEARKLYQMMPEFRGSHYAGCGHSTTFERFEDGAILICARHGIGD